MDDDLRKLNSENKQKTHKIDILKREYDDLSTDFQQFKQNSIKHKKDLEQKLYTEMHTRDILSVEK